MTHQLQQLKDQNALLKAQRGGQYFINILVELLSPAMAKSLGYDIEMLGVRLCVRLCIRASVHHKTC